MKRISVSTVLAGFLVIFSMLHPAHADFADAVQAYDGGDYDSAFSESLDAARQGDADAQYMTGFLYTQGQGTTRNLLHAYEWYALAARQGDSFAVDAMQGLLQTLSATQITEADAWVDDWTPRSP